jgi:hypothetical protein
MHMTRVQLLAMHQDDFDLVETVSKGSFGTVYKAVRKGEHGNGLELQAVRCWRCGGYCSGQCPQWLTSDAAVLTTAVLAAEEQQCKRAEKGRHGTGATRNKLKLCHPLLQLMGVYMRSSK